MGTIGARTAELAVVVTIVTVGAEDPHSDGAGGICAIKVQHLVAQARLSKRAFPIVHDGMAGGGNPVELRDHIQWITGSGQPDGQVAVLRGIRDLAGTGAMATETIFELVERRIQNRNTIRNTDADNSIL